jgi:hypothetical protein
MIYKGRGAGREQRKRKRRETVKPPLSIMVQIKKI